MSDLQGGGRGTFRRRADSVDDTGHFETRRDGVAVEFLGAGVKPHADDAVRIVHATGFHPHPNLAGTRDRVGRFYQLQGLVAARLGNEDASHGFIG